MTSQDEDRQKLNDRAKKLGIVNPHACGGDLLLKKIAEKELEMEAPEIAPEPEVKRSKAPSMKVENVMQDDRTLLMLKMEAEDPDCKYIFQSQSVSDQVLKSKGLERTKQTLKGDVLCRTMKDSYYAVKSARQKADYEAMQRIDGGKGIVGNFQPQAKEPHS